MENDIISKPPKTTTELAVDRTVMAADRSLMAWIRTGLSLISFGFTIYKFLEYSKEQLVANGKSISKVADPFLVGLMLIGMGILSLVFGIIENYYTIKELQDSFSIKRKQYALFMAVLISLFGIFIFLGILFDIKGI